jgi:hypothetical protein
MEDKNSKIIATWIGNILGVFGASLFVMWLWNWVGVQILALPHITYWQSFGIFLLSNLLFKNNSSIIPSNKS